MPQHVHFENKPIKKSLQYNVAKQSARIQVTHIFGIIYETKLNLIPCLKSIQTDRRSISNAAKNFNQKTFDRTTFQSQKLSI